MDRFVDRKSELDELNRLSQSATGVFLSVYGRRRVGKTTLLLHWAKQTGLPYMYWVARRETADATRQSLARALWALAYPKDQNQQPPRFDSWELLLREMARLIGSQRLIIIFDEFPYAVESDPSFPSHLQAAWDHLFKSLPITLILSGSHIGMMVDSMAYSAPLYGRFTGQLPIDALPFAALKEFFPRYEAAERVATYAVLGGVPAYLEQFNPNQNLSKNIRNHLFNKTGMFRNEPAVLISDLVRETRIYEAILRAISIGKRRPSEIAEMIGFPTSNLPPYLKRLTELHLIERQVPATIPFSQRQTTTKSRYMVRDAYLRFYFRFIEPNQEMVEQGLQTRLWERIAEQFRAFVGATTFEDLCREWIVTRARADQLPFMPELVGSYWSKEAQVDVVAINWQERAILLGECKWGVGAVKRPVVEELIAKAPRVVPGEEWQVHYAFFARSGFTEEACQAGRNVHALMVDLEMLDNDLQGALEK